MPSTANIKRADTTTGTVHLGVGADKIGGDTSVAQHEARDAEHHQGRHQGDVGHVAWAPSNKTL